MTAFLPAFLRLLDGLHHLHRSGSPAWPAESFPEFPGLFWRRIGVPCQAMKKMRIGDAIRSIEQAMLVIVVVCFALGIVGAIGPVDVFGGLPAAGLQV